MLIVTRVGLDLAKSVFQVHGVDHAGATVVRRRLAFSQLLGFFGKLSPCIVGMEACSSAHHWARELTRIGHEARLIPPQYVKPYVKRNKTDAADAEAICEAVGRPNMRFVPIKTVAQQAVLALHRVRSLLVRQRTATIRRPAGCSASSGLLPPRARLAWTNCAGGSGRLHRTMFLLPHGSLSRCCSSISMIYEGELKPLKPRLSPGTRPAGPASASQAFRGSDH
jgi:hypothetical protein